MGKKSSKQKTEAQPWQPAQAAITSSLGTVQNVVNGNQGHLESLASDLRGYLPGLAQKAFSPDAGLDAAKGYASDVLGGKYLGAGNPYLNDMIRISGEGVANDVNSRFGAAGRSLSGQHEGVLGQRLMDSQLGLRYTDYTNERNRMDGAAQMMPGLTAAEVSRIAPYLAATEMAGSLPYAGIGALNSTIGLAQGSGTTTSTSKQPWGPALMSAIANGAQAAAMGSDPRLKTDIAKVGDAGPLGIYEWTYRKDLGLNLPEGRFRGVMADEVAKVAPHMLGEPLPGGYLTVRYQPERIA